MAAPRLARSDKCTDKRPLAPTTRKRVAVGPSNPVQGRLMQGGQEEGEMGKPVGAHRSFGVLAVGSSTVSVCREGGGGGSPGTCCAYSWVTIPLGAGLFLPTCLIKMNTINHAQIMKHIQSRAEKMKYDQARAKKDETLPITRPCPRR